MKERASRGQWIEDKYDCNLSREGGGQSGEGGHEVCPKDLGGDEPHMAL